MKKFDFSAGFIFLTAVLYFFDNNGIFSALLPAVAIHELGHLFALRLCGARFRKIVFTISGLRIDYSGWLTLGQEAFAAFSGPFAGIIYAFICSHAGRKLNQEFLLCTAGISYVLSIFNLLPIKPLDGSRIIMLLIEKISDCGIAEKVINALGAVLLFAMAAYGLLLCKNGSGSGLLFAALWIFIINLNSYRKQHFYRLKT